MNEAFKVDDGVQVVELRVEDLLEALRSARKLYAECTSRMKSEICYVSAIGELSKAFGGVITRVQHDGEFNYFIIRGADDSWLIVDVESSRYAIESTRGLAECLFRGRSYPRSTS